MLRVNTADEAGASAVEYSLLIAAIAAVIVLIVFALGGLVRDVFSSTCSSISTKAAPTSPTTENCNN